jgi:hypothetical protein
MLAHIHPYRLTVCLHARFRARTKSPVLCLVLARFAQSRQVPRAPLPRTCPGVACRHLERRYPLFVAPTGSCASPKSSASLCFRSWSRSLQVHANPCWKWDLPDIISAIIRWSPVPIPRERSAVHPSISSRGLTASPLETQDRPFRNLPDATSTGRRRFRGGSNSLIFRLPSLLGPLVAPTLYGAAGPFSPRPSWSVASPSCGIATHPPMDN